MARGRKSSDEVDGFWTLKAARQAQKDGLYPADSAQAPTDEEASKQAVPKVGSRIGRTAMPTKVEVVCYSCGYAFEIVGKTDQTVCSKCRQRLPVTHHRIEGEWSEDITTAGNVVITGEGVICGAHITANMVELAGSIQDGKITASKLLDLREGAQFRQEQVEALDLLIGVGIKHALDDAGMEFRNVEVQGELKADLKLAGKLTVREHGRFAGQASSTGLEIEDGARIRAQLQVRPATRAV